MSRQILCMFGVSVCLCVSVCVCVCVCICMFVAEELPAIQCLTCALSMSIFRTNVSGKAKDFTNIITGAHRPAVCHHLLRETSTGEQCIVGLSFLHLVQRVTVVQLNWLMSLHCGPQAKKKNNNKKSMLISRRFYFQMEMLFLSGWLNRGVFFRMTKG